MHHGLVFESRHGRAAEIAGWSNLLAAFAVAGVALRGGLGPSGAIAVLVGAFTLLRLAMASRVTLPFAALAGSLAVSATFGALAWVFGHVFESVPSAPSIAGVLGALVSGLAPAWAYAAVAQHRRALVPDSLVSPVSSAAHR